jgi:hypothetical protein
VEMTIVDGVLYFDRTRDETKGPLAAAGGGR